LSLRLADCRLRSFDRVIRLRTAHWVGHTFQIGIATADL
jgi:hypothetical protein